VALIEGKCVAEPALLDLSPWLDRVARAKTQKQMYEILEEFKPLAWNDDQRSTIAKLYMRLIPDLPSGADDTASGVGA
jgi:hypothetical protein